MGDKSSDTSPCQENQRRHTQVAARPVVPEPMIAMRISSNCLDMICVPTFVHAMVVRRCLYTEIDHYMHECVNHCMYGMPP